MKDVTEKAHSGSYLLKFPDRIHAIVSRVVEACRPTPVTAKIRLGCSRDRITAFDVAQAVESAGAAALTVHGRVAADFFNGTADWERIAEIKQHLKRIPLIGNGDLDSAEKVVEAFRRYGVDGVMIARASLGRPWLFAQAAAALRGEPIPPEPTLDEQTALHALALRPRAASASARKRERCSCASSPATMPRANTARGSFARTWRRSRRERSFLDVVEQALSERWGRYLHSLAQIRILHALVVQSSSWPLPLHGDRAGFQHVAAVGQLEGQAGVLLDEQDRRCLRNSAGG